MRKLHRGDIYQVRFAPTVFYPSGAPGYVLIMKNDDGSIPCETADVILVNPVCNRSKGIVLGQGFRPDLGRCIRIPKRCLRRRVDSISPKQLWAVDCSFYERYGCRPASCRNVLHWEHRINPAIPVKLVVEVSLWKTQFRLGIRPMRFIGYFAGISPWRM